ncbi:MAG: hypothetical protein IKE73_03345 [Bacilli bacterium]|nr:hypothetical protein [Bacilli bacterium]
MDKFNTLRNEYPEFIYNKYTIDDTTDKYIITYEFIIPGLCEFHPEIKINKSIVKNPNINEDLFNYIVFHVGLVEAISYYKSTLSPNMIIKCGYLDDEQVLWYKDLIFNGLGELLYKNEINTTKEELVNIKIDNNNIINISTNYNGIGNLIPVGGGKDSCVTLELLKNEANNSCFIINPKSPSILCAEAAGYGEDGIITVERTLDPELIRLTKEGYINGHTPFSALVAILSYLCAYLANKKNVVLSNESSANQPTVPGSNINHQYSKSFEFEKNFDEYTKKNFKIDLNYFSLLRGISEYQIGMLFSKYKKYHQIFKSCNLGSKNEPWTWCCNCPKCLFVYIILSPHLYKEELVNIFGEDLYEREDLLETFIDTIGEGKTKPFECVGTIEEAKFAISTLINKLDKDNLPYLLKYYYDNYSLYLDKNKILTYNNENNLNEHYNKLVMEALNND